MIPKRIVAEISKNWRETEGEAEELAPTPILSNSFEHVIEVNAERGFELESWRLDRTYSEWKRELNETIIAVFVERTRSGEHREKPPVMVTRNVETRLEVETEDFIAYLREKYPDVEMPDGRFAWEMYQDHRNRVIVKFRTPIGQP